MGRCRRPLNDSHGAAQEKSPGGGRHHQRQARVEGAASEGQGTAAFSHLVRGTTLRAMGRLEEAIAELRQALQLEESAVGHHELGAALAAKGRWDDAASEYQNAIRLWKNNPLFHSELGGVFQASGQWDKASFSGSSSFGGSVSSPRPLRWATSTRTATATWPLPGEAPPVAGISTCA
ncbi:MAG TPA: tetratricopeptide repeat protein [Gemmataceae bacterium]